MEKTLKLTTYIKTQFVYETADLKKKLDHTLNLDSEQDKILKFLNSDEVLNNSDSSFYIYGGIQMFYRGEEILDDSYEGLVDVMWSNFLHILEVFLVCGKYHDCDSPYVGKEIKLDFDENGKVSLLIKNGPFPFEKVGFNPLVAEEQKMILDKDLFFDTVLNEAEIFFSFLLKTNIKQVNYNLQLEQIKLIRKLLLNGYLPTL